MFRLFAVFQKNKDLIICHCPASNAGGDRPYPFTSRHVLPGFGEHRWASFLTAWSDAIVHLSYILIYLGMSLLEHLGKVEMDFFGSMKRKLGYFHFD